MEECFVARVRSIPVVSSVVGRLEAACERGKQNYTLFRVACWTTELSLRVVRRTAKPILDILEQPLSKLNECGCHHLNKLQTDFPLINSAPDEMLSGILQIVYDVLAGPDINKTDDDVENKNDYKHNKQSASQSPNELDSSYSKTVYSKHTWLAPSYGALLAHLASSGICLDINFRKNDFDYPTASELSGVNEGSLESISYAALTRVVNMTHSLYAEAILQLYSLWAQAFKLFDSLEIRDEIASFAGRQLASLERFLLAVLDWLVNHSPLVLLIPDFSLGPIQMVDDEIEESVMGYVPLHPNDLAAFLLFLQPRRVPWRRCY